MRSVIIYNNINNTNNNLICKVAYDRNFRGAGVWQSGLAT